MCTRFELQFGRKDEPLPGEDIDLSDLQLAINLYRLAVSQPGPHEGDRATFLSNLGDALLDRSAMHELEGDLEAADTTLGEALSVHAEAVAATPRTAPDRPGRLNKLAVAERARADRTSAQADVDAARVSFREACETGLLVAPEMALAAAVNWSAGRSRSGHGRRLPSATGTPCGPPRHCTEARRCAATGRPG